jgi:hypothetical protein
LNGNDGPVADSEDARVQTLLHRAFAFADQDLSGINEAARELAECAGGDVAVMEGAIRRVRAQVHSGGDRRTKQVSSLLRRALEIGEWDWETYEHG